MIDIFTMAGFAGALLIICAWAFEAFEAVERHKSLMDLKFIAIYIIAMSLLFIHSVSINDAVLIFLNGTILVIAAFEVVYSIHVKKVHKRKR
jgi:lipid-A-disaccharide synthase-like uncharacterized protein